MPSPPTFDGFNNDPLDLVQFAQHVRPDWYDDAACRGMGPDIFYPEAKGLGSCDAAQAVCVTCPVSEECREHAYTEKERWGVWGGLTENGRRPQQRRREADRAARGLTKPIPHGTPGGVTAHWRRGIPLCDACRVSSAESRGLARRSGQRAS